MQDLKVFISEKLDLSGEYSGYNYFPKTKVELLSTIYKLISERGLNGDFNDINTSRITDMSGLFSNMEGFNGDISMWDTSNVTNMRWMFNCAAKFNCDISRWDTSKVENMAHMFSCAKSFNQDLRKWNVRNVIHNVHIFFNCPIKDSYKPRFKK